MIEVPEPTSLNGPELNPFKGYIEKLMLTVTVYDDKDNVIKEENIDYSNKEHRLFLGRVTVWAASKDYIVETRRKKE